MRNTASRERVRMDHPRLRAVREAAAQEGFCVVTSREDDGRWTARAYCLGNYREDFVEWAQTEDAAIEAMATRLDARKVRAAEAGHSGHTENGSAKGPEARPGEGGGVAMERRTTGGVRAADKATAQIGAEMKVLRESIWRMHFGVMVTAEGARYRARAFSTSGSKDFEETGDTELAALEVVARRLGAEPPARPM